jgi:hypothetical protein
MRTPQGGWSSDLVSDRVDGPGLERVSCGVNAGSPSRRRPTVVEWCSRHVLADVGCPPTAVRLTSSRPTLWAGRIDPAPIRTCRLTGADEVSGKDRVAARQGVPTRVAFLCPRRRSSRLPARRRDDRTPTAQVCPRRRGPTDRLARRAGSHGAGPQLARRRYGHLARRGSPGGVGGAVVPATRGRHHGPDRSVRRRRHRSHLGLLTGPPVRDRTCS